MSKYQNKKHLAERTIGGLHESLVPFLMPLPDIGYDTPILDIGCGTGVWLDRLAYHGFKSLHGVDLDTSQFGTDKATCSKANLDFDDLGLGDRKFGLISAIELVEHLENPGRLFYHVANHLSANGYFLMTTPNIHSVLCRFRFLITGKLKQFDDLGDPTHIYPVLITALERVLPRHQLQIVKRWSYPLDGSSITSRPALKFAVSILSKLIKDENPGDMLCFLIQKVEA